MNTKRIAELNDKFRTTLIGDKVILTSGIASLPTEQQQEIINKVKIFNTFTEDNDPYGEHDFGCFEYHGQQIFWKIDMYDLNYEYYSPNPELEEVTNRVLTVMFASEY